MTINVALEIGDYLSSREVAASLRNRVVSASGKVTLDFIGVASLSDSFADEFFAVLVEERGFEWFTKSVKVIGLSPSARETILRAVALRCALEAA